MITDQKQALAYLENLYEGVLFVFLATLSFDSEKLSEAKTDVEKEARMETLLLISKGVSKRLFQETFADFLKRIFKEIDFIVEEINTRGKTIIQ